MKALERARIVEQCTTLRKSVTRCFVDWLTEIVTEQFNKKTRETIMATLNYLSVDGILISIKEEFINALRKGNRITMIPELSNSLQKRIDSFNEQHKGDEKALINYETINLGKIYEDAVNRYIEEEIQNADSILESIKEEFVYLVGNGNTMYPELSDSLQERIDRFMATLDYLSADSLLKSIKEELINAIGKGNRITMISELSNNLQDRIDRFIEEHKCDETVLVNYGTINERKICEDVENQHIEAGMQNVDDILESIKEELINAIGNGNTMFPELSNSLQERIDRFIEEHKDDETVLINYGTIGIGKIYEDVVNQYIEEDMQLLIPESNAEEHGWESQIDSWTIEMKEALRESFKSDHPAQYDYELSYKKEYKPTGENKDQLIAVQEFLKAHNAYDFVDKNYLGYLWSLPDYRKRDIPIHLLKNTNDDINNGDDRIVFLAVKWEEEYNNIIREKVFNNKQNADLSSVTKLVQVNVKDKDGNVNVNEYQIVGVLSVGKKEDVSEEVGRAFTNLIDSLHDNEFSNANIEAAKDKDEQFIVSDKTLTIKDIYTGRLLIRADANDNFSKKDSLYDFVKKSTEWSNDVNCLDFAIVSNGMLESSARFDRGEHVSPNSDWMQTHNGAVLLYVPRPDGKYYPVRCTRRSVADWLEKKPNDEYNTGEALLDAVIAEENDNEYLKSIIFNFNSLFDKDNGFKKFMDFKTKLSSFFIFKIFKNDNGEPASPIYVDNFGEDVVVKVYGEEVASIEDFFNVLAEHDVKFTLSLTYLKDNYTRKKERSLIESGVMEIGLRDFYNFNANFLLDPIALEGKPDKKELTNKNTGATDNLEDAIVASLNEEVPSGNNQKQGTFSGEIFLPLKGMEDNDIKTELITMSEKNLDENLSNLIRTILKNWSKPGIKKVCKDILFENADIGFNISYKEINELLAKYNDAINNKLKKEEREAIKTELKDKIECK